MATTGYQAGADSNDAEISYGKEAVYKTKPAVPFQKIRTTGESLSGSKSRARPSEMNPTGEVSAAVTQSETAGGGINFALSFGTYDDLIAGLLNADWQAPQSINGIAADITLTSGTNVLSSTTANKFQNLSVGQWIRLAGFTNPANNGVFRVAAKASAMSLTLNPGTLPFVTETPATTNAKIRASTIINGSIFQSFWLHKKLAAALRFDYPGSYMSAGSISGGVGQFLNGSLTAMSASEEPATADASTGAALEAPAGRVHDAVGGFGGVFLNGVPIDAIAERFAVNLNMTGAAQQYGMGSSKAAGQTKGLLEATGSLAAYFATFTLYQRFKSEALGELSFMTSDADGNTYVITLLNGGLMNPKINAGGPSTPVMATFDLEGNPRPGGGTVRIDRLPAA